MASCNRPSEPRVSDPRPRYMVRNAWVHRAGCGSRVRRTNEAPYARATRDARPPRRIGRGVIPSGGTRWRDALGLGERTERLRRQRTG